MVGGRTKQEIEIVDHVVPLGGRVFSDEMGEMSHALPLTALINRLQNQRYHALVANTTFTAVQIFGDGLLSCVNPCTLAIPLLLSNANHSSLCPTAARTRGKTFFCERVAKIWNTLPPNRFIVNFSSLATLRNS